MSEKYLWDKSGSDPEIENLENVLAIFRYQGSDVPDVTPAIVNQPKPAWARMFSIRLAFGAIAGATLLASLVWLGLPRPATPPELSTSPVPDASPRSFSEIEKDPERSSGGQHAQPFSASTSRTTIARVHTVRRLHTFPQKILVAGKRPIENTEPVAFTKEEKDAYAKLMFALSITGSKLKLIQNTIDRIEDSDSSEKQR